MKRLLLSLLLSLSPFAALAGAGVIQVSTGVTGSHSAEHVVSAHPHHTVTAEVRILRHGPDQAFLVELGQRRDGVHPPLRMDTARAGGRDLDFEPAWRVEDFCTGAGRCSGWRIGAIFMTERAFNRSVASGMRVQLRGPDGVVDLTLPAAMFAEARALATWLN